MNETIARILGLVTADKHKEREAALREFLSRNVDDFVPAPIAGVMAMSFRDGWDAATKAATEGTHG